MCSHDNYSCFWNGRKVFLSYSKKNGCGWIEFSMNVAEITEHRAKCEAEKALLKAQRVEQIKANPERLSKKIEKLNRKIESLKANWQADIDHNDCDAEDTEYYVSTIAECEAELALYI
jgi:DNA repair exonuclease SbcCD ATPase subunit